jgi:putative PIN family toxin of toxin-antitoxin system
MSNRIKVVIDTNVLVSALWSDFGNPSRIIKLMPKRIVPCFNDTILLEYIEVLNRPKFDFSAYKEGMLFTRIKEYGETVIPDESDMRYFFLWDNINRASVYPMIKF